MTVGGKHSIANGMDYDFDFIIPKEKIKKSKVGAIAVSGHDLLHNEAKKYGVNIDNGPDYYVNVSLMGKFGSPTIKITPKTSAGQSVGDAVKAKADEVVATVKDTIRKEIKKQEEKLRDTITKRANQELEKAKSRAQEQIDRTVDSLKNKAKDRVIQKLDTLTNGMINDSLKKKAKDILDKKTTEEVDKIKDKIKDFNPFKKKKG
jgi:Iap family predicted aminopeptidase